MCGRFTVGVSIDKIVEHFGLGNVPFKEKPRFNIAPSQDVPIVRLDARGERELVMAHWGLIPSWAKDRKMGNRMINARAETVATKPAFRSAFRHRRCLVPADGFYEWWHHGSSKVPFWIGMEDHGIFSFAGLWEAWTDRESGVQVESCTIITTDSNELLRPIHDRMPVIISPEHYGTWVDEGTPPDALTELLRPHDADRMTCHEVSRAVNNPRNDSSVLVAPIVRGSPG